MAITQVGSTTTAANTAGNVAGNLSVNVPSGVANGDVMIATVYKALDSVHTLTAPAGWTQVGSTEDAPANIQASVWRRTASSEPSNYTWTVSSTGIWGVAITALRGVDTSSPINTSASSSGAAVDPFSCPNLTTTAATYVLSFAASRDDSTTEVTHTASDTELADWGNDGGAGTRNGAVYLSGAEAAGSYTGLSVNPSGSITNYCAFSVALTELIISGSFAMQLGGVTQDFAATREIPAGDVAMQLGGVTQDFAGQAAPPSGTMDMVLPGITQSFAGNSTGGSMAMQLGGVTQDFAGAIVNGTFAVQLSPVTQDFAGSVNPIGSFAMQLSPVTQQFGTETQPFGEQVIRVEPDHRAFRVIDDDPGLLPIKRSQVTNL